MRACRRSAGAGGDPPGFGSASVPGKVVIAALLHAIEVQGCKLSKELGVCPKDSRTGLFGSSLHDPGGPFKNVNGNKSQPYTLHPKP